MLKTLDVSRLPQGHVIRGLDLADVVVSKREAIRRIVGERRIGHSNSLGFAIVVRDPALLETDGIWDRPYDFIWFVTGWGPDRDRLIANAVRMLRPALREYTSTLDLRKDNLSFSEVVESQSPDGTFPWGDFPSGGAAIIRMPGGADMFAAVSGHREADNNLIARLLIGTVYNAL